MSARPNDNPLPPGTYDGFIVDCNGDDASGLEIDVTLLSGAHKGEVLGFTVPPGAVAAACRKLGADATADPAVALVGLPCDLAVRRSPDGSLLIGFA